MADIGSVLGSRYRLMELLGQGGMATIYRAHDAQLNRDVAVKLLRPEYGRDPEFGSRFRQEAQAAASLNHPNVISVYDYGVDEQGPFIVMERIDGEDIATILRRSGPLAPRQAARLAAEVARALSAAHARGLVHRDVKPGNIMLSSEGRVKVGDFGIARAVADAQMTLPGMTLGSVHYFSPEQARGETATTSSDVYSLGIVLFEALTGRRPFEGDSAASIAIARLSGPPPDPSELREGIPPALTAIVRRALALEPADRFPSAAAMGEALEAFLADRPVAGVGAAAAAAAAAPPPPAPVLAATARPNPARIPYSADAYAGNPQARPGARPGPPARPAQTVPDDEGSGTSSWIWISGVLGLAVLALVAFLVFRLLSSTASQPVAGSVTVPNFVGMNYDQAADAAAQQGLELVRDRFDNTSTQPANTIIGQDPAAGAVVDRGSEIKLTLSAPAQLVLVPSLLNMPEGQAVTAILQAGLSIGDRTDAFDPIVPVGSVISQDPRAGLAVPPGTSVNYEVSKGPEPSPSPSPSPSPTSAPTAAPTPPPTAPPTAPPTTPPTIPPTAPPTATPTPKPTGTPTATPTETPTVEAPTPTDGAI